MRQQYEALIEYLEKRAESVEEYETTHDDAGSNYAHMVSEGDWTFATKQVEERLDHLEIDTELTTRVVELLAASKDWEMRDGSIFVPAWNDGTYIESYAVGEIEDQICLDDLRRDNDGQFDSIFLRGLMLKAKEDRRLCLRFEDKTYANGQREDCAYHYINTDAVWYAVVTDDTLKRLAAEAFEEKILPEITALLEELKGQIGDEYRASEDSDDEAPGMQVTIACSQKFDGWNYQTGDNSYSGGCYGSPYWGVSSLYRDSNAKETAKELISDMLEQIQ